MHELIEKYQEFEAVFQCLNRLNDCDYDCTVRAFQTFGWDIAGKDGDYPEFIHSYTGVIVKYGGSVVAILPLGSGSKGNGCDAAEDLFLVLSAIGWNLAEVYHGGESDTKFMSDMGKAISINMKFDIVLAKTVMTTDAVTLVKCDLDKQPFISVGQKVTLKNGNASDLHINQSKQFADKVHLECDGNLDLESKTTGLEIAFKNDEITAKEDFTPVIQEHFDSLASKLLESLLNKDTFNYSAMHSLFVHHCVGANIEIWNFLAKLQSTNYNSMSDSLLTNLPKMIAYCTGTNAVTYLPLCEKWLANNLHERTKTTESASDVLAAISVKDTPPMPMPLNVRETSPDELVVRVGTKYELADASALAKRFLNHSEKAFDPMLEKYSMDMFIATIILVASPKSTYPRTLEFAAFYLSDPMWDNKGQIIAEFSQKTNYYFTKGNNKWFSEFEKKMHYLLSSCIIDVVVSKCNTHWKSAFDNVHGVFVDKHKSMAPVFDVLAIDQAEIKLTKLKDDEKAVLLYDLEMARCNNGFRLIPNIPKAITKLEETKNTFENLVEPINRFQSELILAGTLPIKDWKITPMLLLGEPGIGKTFLAMQFANALGVAAEKISAGGAHAGFSLTGSHNDYMRSSPGSIFSLLSKSEFATPVVIVDEVEKIHDDRYPVLPVLLDLFDHRTARSFKDEFWQMEFDASRIIFILTANSLEGLPSSLLSRVNVFNIPNPSVSQRRRIINDEWVKLRKKTKHLIKLDISSSERLANRQDIDLRKVSNLIRDAFTKAINSGEKVARVGVTKYEGRLPIGFSH